MSSIWNTVRDAVENSKITNGPKNVRISVPNNVDHDTIKSDLIRGGYNIVEHNTMCCGKKQLYWVVSW